MKVIENICTPDDSKLVSLLLKTQNQESERTKVLLTALDTVNIHQLIHKIQNTQVPTTIIKFLANYLKGRQQYTIYNNQTSKHTNIKTGVPQGAFYH